MKKTPETGASEQGDCTTQQALFPVVFNPKWPRPNSMPAEALRRLSLVSLLATCSTSPSYAEQEYVLTNTAKYCDYSRATPHCVVGLGSLLNTRRTTASLCGFFVRAIQSRPRYDGLDGDTFGCAGSCVPVCQPRPVCHPKLGSLSDGFITHTQEVNHD